MTLGNALKNARKQAGLSQEQLADQLCVSRSAVAKWEADLRLPDVENLHALTQLLNLSMQNLLDGNLPVSPACPPIAAPPKRRIITSYSTNTTRRARIKQRIIFLLTAYLLLSLCLMLLPLSAQQIGLPHLTNTPIRHVTIGGTRPSISTCDPALQSLNPTILQSHLARIQTELEAETFYSRTPTLNLLQHWGANWDWIRIETEDGCYQFGFLHNQFCVEIDGARRYYKEPSRALQEAFTQLDLYFDALDSEYHRHLPEVTS